MHNVPLPMRLVALAVWCFMLGAGKLLPRVYRRIRRRR